MKKISMNKQHVSKLAKYGLSNIPLSVLEVVRFEAGEYIQREEQPIDKVVFVIRGKAKICKTTPDGKNLIVCYYISDGLIGDIELMTRQKLATASVIAISDFECIRISNSYLLKELQRNLYFSNKIGTILAENLRDASLDLVAKALHSGEQRLCLYILQNSYQAIFRDVLTDVASSVGISYRHLHRLLNQLCSEKILEKRESGYHILDQERLVQQAYSSTAN